MKKLKMFLLSALILLSTLGYAADRQSTTVITDPLGNVVTDVYFGPYLFSVNKNNSLTESCYNGASHPCAPNTVSLPITQKDIYITVTGVSGLARATTIYNAYGLSTDTKLYDYGPSLINEQVFTYTPSGNIQNLVTDIVTKNGGGTKVAETQATFDGSGNMLTRKSLVTGSTFLTETFTYNGNGTVATSTGWNGAQTTYASTACGGFETASVSYPITGTQSFSWNCNGAVQTGTTDVNGNGYTQSYSDPFFRPTSGTDAQGVTTTYAYTPTSLTISAPFNTTVSSFDGAGHIVSMQDGSGTVSAGYDLLGRKVSATIPCGGAGSCGQTTVAYGSGSTPTTTLTSPIGGTVTSVYKSGNVLTSMSGGTSLSGGQARQVEYDGLGRLTSVCELTPGTGSVACGQRVAQTGFLTTYTLDALGNVTNIAQGAQTRSFTRDNLGRVLTATAPESGTTTYVYDTSGDCGTSSGGDLLESTDANGNVNCYHYDAISRLTSITHSGPNTTDSQFYVYDTATVGGHAMQNGVGRIVEAYTCTSCPGTKKTDIGFSYNTVGQVVDEYESTTNSGGYYHIALSLYANQAVKTLQLTPAVIPTITYGVDGLGRTSTVVAGADTLVSNTTRGPGNQILSVAYPFGTDTFGYDSALDRTHYTFSLGGNSIVGTLGYNVNGTVSSRTTVDPFNAAVNETCAYAYDRAARLSDSNCGTRTQHFDYDKYGNITMSGAVSFAPTYNTATNRMTAIGVVTPTYDANGNLLTDGTYTYTWDANGNMLSVTGVDSIIYNALGQTAEVTTGANHQQVVYLPDGSKLALMNGQSLILARVPLPGSSKAVYTSSGLSYITHVDNLGSTRVTSSGSSLVSDLSYDPYGNRYNAAGVPASTLSFTGHTQDTVAGLYDSPTRRYNPLQGRWVSSDKNADSSPTDPQTFNLYSYATNRPLAFTDPSGAALDGDSGSDLPYAPGVDPANGPSGTFGGTGEYPADYDAQGSLHGSDLTFNAVSGVSGGYSFMDEASNTLGILSSVDPIGFVVGIDLPEFYGLKYTKPPFIGPYEGADNVIMRLARNSEGMTGNGVHSLKQVEDFTNRVLDSKGSLFKPYSGPRLAAGLTNPFLTRAEVRALPRGSKSALNMWADSVGAKTFSAYEDAAGATWLNGLTGKGGLFEIFDYIQESGGSVHFNLDGLEDIPGNVADAPGARVDWLGRPKAAIYPYANNVTIEELRYLRDNWNRFEPVTIFYRNGSPIVIEPPGSGNYVPW